MSAIALLDLIDALEAEYWDLTQADKRWLATFPDYHDAYEEWHLNNGDCRAEALTAAARNAGGV